jgi:hypothetical protein
MMPVTDYNTNADISDEQSSSQLGLFPGKPHRPVYGFPDNPPIFLLYIFHSFIFLCA